MGKPKKKRSVKALVVKAERTVQKVGAIQVCAPVGVNIDSKTGELLTPVELKLLGEPVFTPTVVPCKLINHGLQKACLIVKRARPSNCDYVVTSKVDLDIPIFGMHDIPDIQPGDHVQEKAEVESIDIRGIRDPNANECGAGKILIIKIVYKVEVCVAREETICISDHCPGKNEECGIQEGGFQDIVNKNNINIVVNPFQPGSKKFV